MKKRFKNVPYLNLREYAGPFKLKGDGITVYIMEANKNGCRTIRYPKQYGNAEILWIVPYGSIGEDEKIRLPLNETFDESIEIKPREILIPE